MLKQYLGSIFEVFGTRRRLQTIQEDSYLWNKKPIREKSVLLWDLENIPFSRLEDIKRIAKYTPQDLYVVTKQNISVKNRAKIEKAHFKILDAHKGISDDKIISIMNLYDNKPDMILISADSDFVNTANKYIKKNKLQWIVTEANKKAVIMRANLASSNLTISTLPKKENPQNKHTQKKSTISKVAPSTKIIKKNRLYNIPLYYYGVFKRSLINLKQMPKIARDTFFNSFQTNEATKNVQDHFVDNADLFFTEHTKYLLENKDITPIEFSVYRRNYNNKLVKTGKILQYSSDQNVLMLYKKIARKYQIPNFKMRELFRDIEEVSHLINYNDRTKMYYLNKFDRKY